MDENSNIKKSPKRAIKFLIFCFLFTVLCFLFIAGIYSPKDSSQKETKLFLIEKGQGVFQIAKNLEKEGLIKNRLFFDFYAYLKWSQHKLQAGKYELSPSMDVSEIAKKIIKGEIFQIKITIPEGFTLKQIEETLSLSLQRPVLCQYLVSDFKGEFDFLKDIPDETSLEGFLFPDTYYIKELELNNDEEIKNIFKKMLINFDKKITSDLRQEISEQNKSIFQIVTMASLIEKEVKTLEDKKIVSGILWKRLKVGMPLQVDATINYITGKKTIKISEQDTQIDSLYNTYKYRGLPPGPICNPWLESIEASLYPESSEHWYYLSTPEGETIFSKTLQEHNIAKDWYLK